MKRRPFHLSYPCAVLATVLIVGGAPPASSGLTGCAAPIARSPESNAPLAPPAALASAHAATEPMVGLPPRSASSAAPTTTSAVPELSTTPPAVFPREAEPVLPSAPPHPWRGGEFQSALVEFARWVKKNGGVLGAELEDVASGTVLGSVAASRPENPASNQKILTTAAVLRHFGADFRFRTTVCGTRSGETVPALVLRGGGDPSLSSQDLKGLAQTLARAGVRHVGNVLVDQGFFDDRFVPPAFEQQPEEWAAFRAPVSAASLNRNTVTLHVAPTEVGEPARVWFDPEGFVDVAGTVSTEAMERTQNVRLTLKESGMRLSAQVGGGIQPQSAPFQWSRRVEDPRLLAGYGFKLALAAEGIAVSGAISLGGAAEQTELAFHDSEPLSELLPELGKDSDNFYAETLLKDLGAKVKGIPGTSRNGAAVVVDYLREIDALDPGTHIGNGSGLFDANRVSAHTLVKTLRSAYRDPALSRVFVAQLAVGGVDGTLKHRFGPLKKQRTIHAKTGTLDRVIALSGFAFRPDGSSPVAFSLIVTGIAGKHAEVRKRVDGVVSSVARVLARDAN